MHVAAANGYREAAMLLIDLGGADVNIEDDLGYTPLHIAAKYNQVGMLLPWRLELGMLHVSTGIIITQKIV